MMRQGANSAVRFTTYTTLKQSLQSRTRAGQTLPSSFTFGIGAVAGLVTVYTTMPLEYVILPLTSWIVMLTPLFFYLTSVIKTRMQSLDAHSQYRNSFHCAYRTFTEEGILRFWTGTTPRLGRLMVRLSFALSFLVRCGAKMILNLGERGNYVYHLRKGHCPPRWARDVKHKLVVVYQGSRSPSRPHCSRPMCPLASTWNGSSSHYS